MLYSPEDRLEGSKDPFLSLYKLVSVIKFTHRFAQESTHGSRER